MCFDHNACLSMISQASVSDMAIIALWMQVFKTKEAVKSHACHLYPDVKMTADSKSAVVSTVSAQISESQLRNPQ